MKTKLVLTLTAALAFGLSACGGDDDDDGKSSGIQSECTSNADCADRSDGKTACDVAKKECVAPVVDEPECTSDADCADRSDGKTECDTDEQVCVAPAAAESGAIKISQVYLAGYPNIGSKYDASYIELFNAGTNPINLKDYSVVYGSNNVTNIVSLYDLCINDNCIVPAGGYFLIKVKASGVQDATAIEPDIDLQGKPNMGVNGVLAIGRVAGLSGSEADCEVVKAAVDDLIGMGSNEWCHEGSANATGIAQETRANQAYFRKEGGCLDTDDNANDYEVVEASFRNGKTTPAPCAE